MRLSTGILLLTFAAAAAGLVWSIRAVESGGTRDGKRVYVLAAWGAAQEADELRTLVVDPINAAARNFRVRLAPIPSDYATKLSTMIAGGTPPEFFYLSQEHVAAFAAQGALADLTDRIERDNEPVTDLSQYYPSVLEQYRHDGRLWGLPWIAQPVVLYCNVRLFREAGVKLPDKSWRWRHFVAAGKRLTRDLDGDGRIDQWGFVQNGWPPCAIWAWQNGGEIVDRRTGRLNLSDPRVAEAMDFYAGLIHRDRIAPPLSIVGESGFSEMFRAGEVAMFMGGAADDLDRTEGLEVRVAELPAGPTGLRATFAWSAGLHMSAAVADRDAAFEVYKRILDRIQRWKVPAPRRPLAARLEEFEPRKAAAADVIRAAMETMRTPHAHPRQSEFETLFWEEFEDKLLRTGEPAADLAARAAPVLERLR